MTIAMKSLSVRISDELDRLLSSASVRRGVSKTVLTKEALAVYFSNSSSRASAIASKARNATGERSVRDAMSANPKRRKGSAE